MKKHFPPQVPESPKRKYQWSNCMKLSRHKKLYWSNRVVAGSVRALIHRSGNSLHTRNTTVSPQLREIHLIVGIHSQIGGIKGSPFLRGNYFKHVQYQIPGSSLREVTRLQDITQISPLEALKARVIWTDKHLCEKVKTNP